MILDNKYISYSFETSRLGYLLRRPICGGLIALYSIEHDSFFYDYADKILSRLLEERETQDWKKKETVNIRIPYVNILQQTSLQSIHEIFKRRFEQGHKMQNIYGLNFGLPVISTNNSKYDFNNANNLKEFLKEMVFYFYITMTLIFYFKH